MMKFAVKLISVLVILSLAVGSVCFAEGTGASAVSISSFEKDVLAVIDKNATLNVTETENGYSFEYSSVEMSVDIQGTANENKMIQSVTLLQNTGEDSMLYKKLDSFLYGCQIVDPEAIGEKLDSYTEEKLIEDYAKVLAEQYDKIYVWLFPVMASVISIAPMVNVLSFPDMDDEGSEISAEILSVILQSWSQETQVNGWKYNFRVSDEKQGLLFTAEFTEDAGLNIKTSDSIPEVAETYWKYEKIMDEFGDVTEQGHIVGTFVGEFSNTATSASDLLVNVYFNGDNTTIELLEYSTTKATYTTEDIILKTKINNDVQEYALDGMAPNGELILRNYGNDNYAQLVQALYDGEEISCVIYIGSSKYNFKIQGTGFAMEYNSNYN